MSSTSTPNRSPQPGSGTPRVPISRTLAIIKAHAVKHRLTIERRIVEAGFEIIKERQMAFNPESDREVLVELFGRDADSLGHDPVWVYVLERRRAVEVWLTLMGPESPEVAQREQPNSLRAVYGVDMTDNAFIGSPDPTTAEAQIETLFASSPVFPSVDQDTDGLDADPMMLSPPRGANSHQYDSVSSRRSSVSAKSAGRSNVLNGSGFKARPVPATNASPDIAPRLTRAASLRIGLTNADDDRRPTLRERRTKEEQHAVFMDVPGHKRSSTIQVASTAAPVIAPRATKASVLREYKESLAKAPTWGAAKRDVVPTNDRPQAGSANFEGVPGHKRRESLQVASTQTPTVAPRPNRAAELRAAKAANGPPTSFKTGGPAPSRRLSTSDLSDKIAAAARSASSMGSATATSTSSSAARPSGSRAPPSAYSNGTGNGSGSARSNSSLGVGPDPIKRSTSALAAPVKKPDIEPRTNRSALLREQKKLEAQAAAAKNRF